MFYTLRVQPKRLALLLRTWFIKAPGINPWITLFCTPSLQPQILITPLTSNLLAFTPLLIPHSLREKLTTNSLIKFTYQAPVKLPFLWFTDFTISNYTNSSFPSLSRKGLLHITPIRNPYYNQRSPWVHTISPSWVLPRPPFRFNPSKFTPQPLYTWIRTFFFESL